jgi:hypothetical protein
MQRNLISTYALVFSAVAILGGCGSFDSEASDKGGVGYEDANGGGTSGGGDTSEPPELNFKYLTPRASRDYVFVPNETLDTVSKIDADSLAVTTIPVGDRPTRIEAIDGQNNAVVLNQNSDEVSLIRADALITSTGTADEEVRIKIDTRMNALALSPDGVWALAYFSFANQEEGEPDGNLQTISFIRTTPGDEAVFHLSVGFQIRAIQFLNAPLPPDATPDTPPQTISAFIITDTGLSILDLTNITADAILPVIPVTTQPLLDPLDREVYVLPSGDFAISRDRAEAAINLIRLSDGEIHTIDLPMPATDLDLVPGEDTAFVTVRDADLVLEIPIAAAFDDPSAVITVDAGSAVKGLASLDPTGRWLVLYSSFTDQITLIDRQAPADSSLRRRITKLPKLTRGLAMAPDGKHALVFHAPQEPIEGDSDAQALIRAKPGYSVLDLESGFSRLISSEIEVDDFTFWFNGEDSFAFVSFVDENTRLSAVERIELSSALIERLNLSSPVSHLGRLAGRQRVWVNQDHPLGRMTFVDVFSGQPKTITGFELNRRIQ